ncbi:MAG: hypothetical protein A2017_18295 [Lentisphaerae bacterium GWF2_44_16]|nr:MAG: hypothetical protein A2017_18295 [Lentisphaerae bacterium GWF2_44_16]
MSGKRVVTFLGFFTGDKWYHDKLTESFFPGEVWTLTDPWYFYPKLKPTRIYQIHEDYDGTNPAAPYRTWPDWKGRYNSYGCEIVTRREFPGLNNQRVLDMKKLVYLFSIPFFGSSFAYMFADAMLEKVTEIHMYGIRLATNGEYQNQLPSMILNLEAAKVQGIKIVCPFENEWFRERDKFDWALLKEVKVLYGDENGNYQNLDLKINPDIADQSMIKISYKDLQK